LLATTRGAGACAPSCNSFVTLLLNKSQQIRLTIGGPADRIECNPTRTLSPKYGLTEKGEFNHEY
jgi:hypothetical protein